MHDFLKLHHNWDAYMGVQKERKSTFLTAFEQRQKEARSLFAAQYLKRIYMLNNIYNGVFANGALCLLHRLSVAAQNFPAH